ncbi:MAG: hypothetical protein ACI8WB_001670 [Phenylobacterium sp.]|jgi:hypothetical protein
MKINKIKKVLLVIGLGIGLSGMVNAGPRDGFNRCDNWYVDCFENEIDYICQMYYQYC